MKAPSGLQQAPLTPDQLRELADLGFDACRLAARLRSAAWRKEQP